MKQTILAALLGSVLTMVAGYSIGVLDGRREGREAADRSAAPSPLLIKAPARRCSLSALSTLAADIGVSAPAGNPWTTKETDELVD